MQDTSLTRDRIGDLPYWLAINEKSYAFHLESLTRALERTPSILDLWNSSDSTLTEIGLDNRTIASFRKVKADFQLEEQKRMANSLIGNGVSIIKFTDSNYPQLLRHSPTALGPPLLIFAKGDYVNFINCVAIVGTRNCSFHGRTMARTIARKLSDKGYTIVSGLARGVDEEAHCGALESKRGRTLAVLPWLEPIYPEEHSELVRDIERRGARISENYMRNFGQATPAKFVERNRITSGISRFIIAIETDVEGGTIRQAELARQQDRPIFVLRPKDNERAKRGFDKLLTEFRAIEFTDDGELLQIIRENKLEPEEPLDRYRKPSQLKLT